MKADDLYKRASEDIGLIPVICGAGLEHSEYWIEVEAKGGEDKIIACPVCMSGIVQEYFKDKIEAMRKMFQHMQDRDQLETFLKAEGEGDE